MPLKGKCGLMNAYLHHNKYKFALISMSIPSAVGSKHFSSVLALLSAVGENASSWLFKSTSTFGKSFNAGAAILKFLDYYGKLFKFDVD